MSTQVTERDREMLLGLRLRFFGHADLEDDIAEKVLKLMRLNFPHVTVYRDDGSEVYEHDWYTGEEIHV